MTTDESIEVMTEGLRQMAARMKRGTPLAEVLATYSAIGSHPAWMQMEIEEPELPARAVGGCSGAW